MTSLPDFQKRRFFHVGFAVLAKHLVTMGTKTCQKVTELWPFSKGGETRDLHTSKASLSGDMVIHTMP